MDPGGFQAEVTGGSIGCFQVLESILAGSVAGSVRLALAVDMSVSVLLVRVSGPTPEVLEDKPGAGFWVPGWRRTQSPQNIALTRSRTRTGEFCF